MFLFFEDKDIGYIFHCERGGKRKMKNTQGAEKSQATCWVSVASCFPSREVTDTGQVSVQISSSLFSNISQIFKIFKYIPTNISQHKSDRHQPSICPNKFKSLFKLKYIQSVHKYKQSHREIQNSFHLESSLTFCLTCLVWRLFHLLRPLHL